MTKYIERQYLLDTIDVMIVYRKTPTDIYEMVEDALTIDVVRCKDCKYYNGEYSYCVNDIFAKPNGFCSYGEKKK